MNDLYDILELCLQELENGVSLESLLTRYPQFADELRPILEASIAAREMSAPGPTQAAVRNGRAKLMQRAAQLREEKTVSRKRVIPVFQRLAISFALTALFLASGTGLVGASSTALPGENLYPVKRTWEGLRLFFTFDTQRREFLESEFEFERLDEVSELLAEGRHETIQFAGVFMDVNGTAFVSGVHIVISANTQLPVDGIQSGAAVIVTGRTNASGFVEAESIVLLPPGVMVPVGQPVEVETEDSESVNSNLSESGAGSGSTGEAQNLNGAVNDNVSVTSSPIFKIEGIVASMSNETLVINGQVVYLKGAEVRGRLVPGAKVEVEGYFDASGKFIVTKVEVEESDSSSSVNSEDDNSNDNSNDDSSDDGESDDNSNDSSSDDNSGSGGGDDD